MACDMTNKFKQMQLQTLDQHLRKVTVCDRPSDGWVRSIRGALGMSVRQLAERIGISQQALSQLEGKEVNDSVTVKTLRKAAEAMDCKLVYALVPNEGSLERIIEKQALKKARAIVQPVDHSMQLEAQGVGDSEAKTQQLAKEMTENLNSKLWD